MRLLLNIIRKIQFCIRQKLIYLQGLFNSHTFKVDVTCWNFNFS